jgi:hypothetical protein
MEGNDCYDCAKANRYNDTLLFKRICQAANLLTTFPRDGNEHLFKTFEIAREKINQSRRASVSNGTGKGRPSSKKRKYKSILGKR